ncbi:MAG: serine/threonine-protein kinase [Acidobacteriota bacterium]
MGDDSFAAGLVGIVLDGRYRLDALLGEGGMGAVFRAHHLAMDRRVAVKLLKPHLTSDAAQLERFAREARSTMRVDSPHAVKVLDFGVTPQRDYYMVLEYVDGRTVQRELDVDGPFAPARVVHIARQALHALGAAHRSGLVHRDLKPENIILTRQGDDPDFAKLLDFGVAKLMEGAARSDRSAMAITQSGMVFGTPEFMSPEQACGQTVDGRSDLYSLAATMFGMLTGCAMYAAKTPIEFLMHHARTPAPHLGDALPALAEYGELDAVLQHCFAKHREARPQTAEELARMLAGVEPTLRGRGRSVEIATSATLLPGRMMRAAHSAYVEALPEDTLPPSPTTGMVQARKGRGMWIALGSLLVLGVIAGAIAMAMRDRTRPSASTKTSTSTSTSTSTTDRGPADAAVVAQVVPDAAPPPAADAALQVTAIVREPPRANPEIAKHLAAAEQAKAAGNRLREIAEADSVLHLDPHNVRAHILIADGLIATGSNESGCKYLHGLGRYPSAARLARSASCPSD